MEPLSVDPSTFVHGPEDPNGPVIPVVVSLTFPGMNEESLELMQSFTEVGFQAIREAGGRPVLVDSAAAEFPENSAVLENAAGVVFLGGGDVDGSLYGLPPEAENSYGVDRRADEYCIALMQDTLERDLPLLAICRGSQLFNVAHGGTLIPDIEDPKLHRGVGGEPMFLDEEILLEPESKVGRLYGEERLTVRSGHHQAVDRVGEGLVVTARAHDGIIEGTENPSARWAVGVQWHPEDPKANPADRSTLFTEFIDQARETE